MTLDEALARVIATVNQWGDPESKQVVRIVDEQVKKMQAMIDPPPSNVEPLPKAKRLPLMTAGRSFYAIDGVPGLYLRKKPYGFQGQPVEADECVGKGRKPKWFYRERETENRLLAAMGMKQPPEKTPLYSRDCE